MRIAEILNEKILLRIVFTISTLLIIILSFVNDGSANDEHLPVSKLIYSTGEIPYPLDCWSCYHPKLYHYTVAKLWWLFDVDNDKIQIIVSQLVNGIAGIISIYFILLFILKLRFSSYVKLLSFSLIALNPRLISIVVQPSNDAFVILFGTLKLYFFYNFIKNLKQKDFYLFTGFSILASLSKTSGFILLVGILVVFILKVISDRNLLLSIKKGLIKWTFVFCIVSIGGLSIFGDYYKTYKKHGTIIYYNTPTGDLPHLYKETVFRRAGVKSILGAYFTFYLFDMVKNPVVTNGEEPYPKHRTSLWSQLYGRTHFLYFDDWPYGKWQKVTPFILLIGSVTFILALIPSLMFIVGLIKELGVWLTGLLKKDFGFIKSSAEWIFHIFILGFIGFIVLFTLKGRDFSFMKIIYLFPAILAAVIPLMKGVEMTYNLIKDKRKMLAFFNFSFILLLICYLIPIVFLIFELTEFQ